MAGGSRHALAGFCGWAGIRDSTEVATTALRGMSAAIARSPHAPMTTLMAPQAAVAGSRDVRSVQLDRASGYLAAYVGSPRLGHHPAGGDTGGSVSPRLLIDEFLRHGEDLLRDLTGAFALAVVSEHGGDGLLAIDRVGGRHPLAYATRGNAVVFGTDVAGVQAHPVSRSEIDPQSIYNYLYFSVVPSPRSIRRDVQLLTPGTYLRLQNGTSRVGRYWSAHYRDDDAVSLSQLCEEFRELIDNCVGARGSEDAVGCFLSGGTDSSTVAGVLGQVAGGPARTYSIGFGTEGYDELAYARLAANHFRTDHHEYRLSPEDLLEWIPRVATAYAEPFGNASALPALFCAKLAREDGVKTMLAGDGGDEIFAGNERYARQKMFELYFRIPAGLRRWLLEPLVFGIPAGSRLPVVSKARSYVRQAKIPMPRRLETYNLFERVERSRIVDPEFSRLIDPEEPATILEHTYNNADSGTLVNRMLALDLKFTIADNDLPKVSRMCQLAGVEVAYPFLDDEMIEFSFRVPARLKL